MVVGYVAMTHLLNIHKKDGEGRNTIVLSALIAFSMLNYSVFML